MAFLAYLKYILSILNFVEIKIKWNVVVQYHLKKNKPQFCKTYVGWL